jgi:choline-sulfatase
VPEDRPNVLLFLTDDHGAWALGSYSNREVRSPVLDGLAREGARFENAFTPSPVCSPARACLLTGKAPSQVGIHDWIQEQYPRFAGWDWLAGVPTLAELLAEAGYRCYLSGKWHLGRSHETPPGYDRCFGLPGWQGDHLGEYEYVLDGERITLEGNKTRFITDHALRFLGETPEDEPFFLNVGYIATHSPYGDQEPDLLALYEDATFEDIPPYEPHPWLQNEGFPQEGHSREDCLRRYRGYYAAVTDMDRNVGRILETLREQGRLKDTVIVFTSDHGCALGHHGFWGKGNSTRPLNMYETSLRVPLIWRWPGGTEPGRTVRCCVDHYDTFRTLCEISGVELPHSEAEYPGRSYLPMLRGEEVTDWDDTRYGEYGDLRMVRTPRHKLVRRYPDGPDDLFDLEGDPDETKNLSGSTELKTVEAELRERLEAFYSCYEDSEKSGLKVKELPQHNASAEAWRDGRREARGLQVY